jgi:hypothetical protein
VALHLCGGAQSAMGAQPGRVDHVQTKPADSLRIT